MSRDAGEDDAPDSKAPDSAAPDSAGPDSAGPDSAGPDSAAPDSDASKAPDSGARAQRPTFAKSYPAHPKLDKLLTAYQAGNFGYVRSHAQELAQGDDDELAAAAADLRRRIEPHPLATVLWALGLALLVLLYGYYLMAAHEH